MQSDTPKQYLLLDGKPVLYYTLKAFENSNVDTIILVVGNNEIEYVKTNIINRYEIKKVNAIVEGGKERYHSVYQGLKAVGNSEYVLIHDGARPFITKEMIEKVIEKVEESKACVVGVPVKDTIKIVDDSNFIVNTPDRSRLWSIQTPQAFSTELITKAYSMILDESVKEDIRTDSIGFKSSSEKAITKSVKAEPMKRINITDDAMVLEYTLNYPVQMIYGSYYNIKITTPEDLIVGEAFLNDR
ncbi:2-C-methyl-D-erythritol 4-phosphate cytidylyltransferase [Anaerocolumna cellulosilytica]|uniref:2-C-methyl-D-erythritol 4-phosphate cytidylyltransferase n=2 Tax=Anaerocolumna cellulosilytica TaxID=433286 RepID=A0A6S6R3D1_9FIRM|nr:2-C-methyl-D-erythritol 4-phosphate cytidylyltransferase [Anaerocolumna cellulosilytica]